MIVDKSTWYGIALAEHYKGKTRDVGVRARLRAMLKGDWSRFAAECGLDLDPGVAPTGPVLPTTTFQHVPQPPTPPLPPVPQDGPGTRLKSLLASLDVHGAPGCGCADYARQMDLYGVQGCRERRAEIVAWLKKGFSEQSWGAILKAASKGVGLVPLSALAGGLDGVCNWLLDESIRKAESKSKS